MSRLVVSVAVLCTVAATAAQAHTGTGHASGFGLGLAHPFSGLDHLLAMFGVGLLAARLGGRALFLLPVSFLALMICGAAVGMAGSSSHLVETGIALSVIVLGLAVRFGFRIPVAAAMGLVGLFAIFHGHTHGAEMSQAVSDVAYGSGFLLGTALLHAVGIGFGLAIDRIGEDFGRRAVRLAGTGLTLAGIGLLAV